jgi:hypothetical protein
MSMEFPGKDGGPKEMKRIIEKTNLPGFWFYKTILVSFS